MRRETRLISSEGALPAVAFFRGGLLPWHRLFVRVFSSPRTAQPAGCRAWLSYMCPIRQAQRPPAKGPFFALDSISQRQPKSSAKSEGRMTDRQTLPFLGIDSLYGSFQAPYRSAGGGFVLGYPTRLPYMCPCIRNVYRATQFSRRPKGRANGRAAVPSCGWHLLEYRPGLDTNQPEPEKPSG